VPQRDEGEPQEGLPKLTIAQRVLASLPDLQRGARRPGPARGAAARPGGSGDGATGAGAAQPVRPDAVIGPASSGTSGSRPAASTRRTPTSGSGQRANPYANMSVADLRHAMKHLDDRDRLFPMLVGPLLAVLDLALTAVAIHDNPPLHHKGHADPGTILAVGIGSAVIALLVVVAAALRRRSFTIFALLFSGYGGGLTTMLPAWFVAGWLFVRFNRMQKAVVAKTGGPAAAREASAKARATRLDERRAAKRAKGAPEPAGPSASKRYTPPKPGRARPAAQN
jgi:hypothetical protein